MVLGLVSMAMKSLTGPLKILCTAAVVSLAVFFAYSRWAPGLEITDGRHDRGRNGIWIQHAWLGDDKWFIRNNKKDKIGHFRNPENIQKLASLLHYHNITDVFPHLCPTFINGNIPDVDRKQAELFLQAFRGFRVMPWVGGVWGVQAFPERKDWRRNFAESIRSLFTEYPDLSGIHINIEPCPSGNKDFLVLLEDVRKVLPKGKIVSLAAFPPPTLWQPFSDVHWDKGYYKEASQRTDQVVVMMYDTSINLDKVYQHIMRQWTGEVLGWAEGVQVLLGLPAYEDKDVGYHNPKVENLKNALLGIHSGLSRYQVLPQTYQGIAIYCEWEMDNAKWELLQRQFERTQQR